MTMMISHRLFAAAVSEGTTGRKTPAHGSTPSVIEVGNAGAPPALDGGRGNGSNRETPAAKRWNRAWRLY